MNKKIALLIIFSLMLTTTCAISAPNNQGRNRQESSKSNTGLDKDTIYYPNANIKSAIAKYKSGNYSGCLQELFSLTKKDPSNAAAYYYMAMAYTHIDMKNDAIEAYEKVLALSPNSYLAEYAEKGRDCLNGGPKCHPEVKQEELTDLDKFINAPYGNGLSNELNKEVKQKPESEEFVMKTNNDGVRKLVITRQSNIEKYELLAEQIGKDFYQVLSPFRNVKKIIDEGKEKFGKLLVIDQCYVLMQILSYLQCKGATADLQLIGGSGRSGQIRFNKDITNVDFRIYDTSPTGLFVKESKA